MGEWWKSDGEKRRGELGEREVREGGDREVGEMGKHKREPGGRVMLSSLIAVFID